ncbi:cytochrome [Gottfriedia luciferensis]|uniref:Cytochrome n=1 Tax=Gottfriedia luciferensis TaxID=178774 RepID=A0ABX2ZVL0_9BACI|nr:cytochrome P450 [Gottfriedia luciferensis]ODG93236.1 cytochrome [Gottfriedia luciferensis]
MKTDYQAFSFTTEFFQNPYQFYEKLRSMQPIYRGNLIKNPGWYVTGYEEAITILKDKRFKNRIPLPEGSKKYEQLKNIQKDMMLFKNKSDHRRLRFLVSNVFTPKIVEQLRPSIEETVNELLQPFQNQKSLDVVSDLAFPLASLVIARIIGVPKEDLFQFREWATSLIQSIDFTRRGKVLENGDAITIKAMDYFNELIRIRKLNPKEDLISKLIMEEQQGDKLSDDELLATCILLVIAGHETTINLISNSVLTLLNHPKQLMKLKENSFLIDQAVEECLRYESPTQMIARVATEDIDIHNTSIKKGDQIYLLLGAANRDPHKFHNPNQFDITRNPNPHISFGNGAHFCLGAPLARLEAQIAIKTLLDWKKNIQLASSNLKWQKLIGFRSLKELPIIFD